MNLFTRAEDFLFWLVTASLTAVAGGVWWMIRLVFTNQQQIELMRADLAHRDQLRQEDREDMAEIKGSVQLIQQHLLGDVDEKR